MADDDLELVRQVLLGEVQAFEQLVARYQNYVFSVALSVVRQREEAEEIAQDTFVKVYKQLGSFAQRSRFSTWLYKIAYRTALDYARKKRLPVQQIQREDGSPIPIADTDTGPEGLLQQHNLQEVLEEALVHLKPEDALLVRLYYLRERSVREMVDITGLTESNIKTRLFRIREQLRQLLTLHFSNDIQDWL